VTITLDQLRRELGLTRAEGRELQYAAVEREVSTRELIRRMLVWCSAGRPTPAWLWQSQSTRSAEQGSRWHRR
jgi:hypothetical protein